MEESPLEVVRLWEHQSRYRRRLMMRSEGDVAGAVSKARDIVNQVRDRGDIALVDLTEKFDGVRLGRDQLRVSDEDVSEAYEELKERDIEAIEKAAGAVERYHEEQVPSDWLEEFERGVSAGQVVRPLSSVGCYVPGGTAQYPSSVLMSVVPAKVAGVERIVVCSPPDSNGSVSPATLIAADVAGADEVYRVGGAQAIGAMAYGTRNVPAVSKIVGPGNVYVSAAKKVVSSRVDIDFMAGPSEVLIWADSTADPRLAAVDLVAQAEHDPSSASVLVTTSEVLAEDVSEEVRKVLEEIPRKRTAAKALRQYGGAVVVKSKERAIRFVNDYAPEHLQIMTADPEGDLDRVKNAGAIFLGPYSPTSAGDFNVGPSHILPTGGDARLYSGISVLDFIRQPSVQKLSREGLERLSDVIKRLTRLEGLAAHAKAVEERLEE